MKFGELNILYIYIRHETLTKVSKHEKEEKKEKQKALLTRRAFYWKNLFE